MRRMKVFSKRHPNLGKGVTLSQTIRQRLWYAMIDSDPHYDGQGCTRTLVEDALPATLVREHGWEELDACPSVGPAGPDSCEDLIQRGDPRFLLDALELFHDLLKEAMEDPLRRSGNPAEFEVRVNSLFKEAGLPWRMLQGRITKVDSQWMEEEVHARATELLSANGFEGALEEFLRARDSLTGGDLKNAMREANLALESTMKAILGVGKLKPGELARRLVASGLVPEYHEGFLRAFEEHILRAVPVARNEEGGVGHGQGPEVNNPPQSLAEFAVNLSGAVILYLMKRHVENRPAEDESGSDSSSQETDVPF